VTAINQGVATIVASNPGGMGGELCSDSIRVRGGPEPSSAAGLIAGVLLLC
jgi:hypothetical protein